MRVRIGQPAAVSFISSCNPIIRAEALMRLSSNHFVCACVTCLCLAGCSNEKAAAPAAPRPARIVVVTPHKLALVAQGAGRIQSRYVSQVGFEVGGRLISRDVDTGAIVRKGQKLAE